MEAMECSFAMLLNIESREEKLRKENRSLHQRNRELEAEIREWKIRYATQHKQLNIAETGYKIFERKSDAMAVELDSLKKTLKAKDELTLKTESQFKLEKKQLEDKLKLREEAVEKITHKYDTIVVKETFLNQTVANLQCQLESKETELCSLRNANSRLKESYDDELNVVKKELSDCFMKKKQNEDLVLQVQCLESEMAVLESKLRSSKELNSSRFTEIKELNHKNDQQREKIENLQIQNSVLKRNSEQRERKVQVLELRVQELSKEIEEQETKSRKLAKEFNTYKERHPHTKQTVEEFEGRIEELEYSLESASSDLFSARKMKQEVLSKVAELNSRIQCLDEKLDERGNRIQMLEEEIEMVRANAAAKQELLLNELRDRDNELEIRQFKLSKQ